MTIFILSLEAILSITSVIAQSDYTRLVLFGDAAEEVPADQATLTVNLNFSDERGMKLVYEEHKKARQQLTDLLN